MYGLWNSPNMFAIWQNNKYLRELNLSHNQFSEVGAEFLGPAISKL